MTKAVAVACSLSAPSASFGARREIPRRAQMQVCYTSAVWQEVPGRVGASYSLAARPV